MPRHPRYEMHFADRILLDDRELVEPRVERILGLEAESVKAEGQHSGFGMYLVVDREEGKEIGAFLDDAGCEAKGSVAAPAVDVECLTAEDIGVDMVAEFGWEAEK